MDATIRVSPLVVRLDNGDSISETTHNGLPAYQWWRKGGTLAGESFNLHHLLTLAISTANKR